MANPRNKPRKKESDVWGIIVYILGIVAIVVTVAAIIYMALK